MREERIVSISLTLRPDAELGYSSSPQNRHDASDMFSK
jgi:hypothetical protein